MKLNRLSNKFKLCNSNRQTSNRHFSNNNKHWNKKELEFNRLNRIKDCNSKKFKDYNKSFK